MLGRDLGEKSGSMRESGGKILAWGDFPEKTLSTKSGVRREDLPIFRSEIYLATE